MSDKAIGSDFHSWRINLSAIGFHISTFDTFEKPVVYNYGTGFRYLLARKFKLRMEVDVGKELE